MDCVLGIDGGGTKTIAVSADASGAVMHMALGDGLDPTADNAWEARLATLVAHFGPVAAATLGLPFHGEIPEVSARQVAVTTALLGAQVQVVNDVAVAFEGALAEQDGVLILAGTGSMAWARGPEGTRRIGGWGDAFGDEGSAFWIGREALGLVSQHLDGRRISSDFATGILAALGISGDGLIAWSYTQPSPRAAIAAVAVHVSGLAAKGNREALSLMAEAASLLSVLGQTAARESGARAPLHWSYAGGVFNDEALRKAVSAAMGNAPLPPVLPPVGGAVLAAAKSAGWATGSDFITRLSQSLARALPSSPVTGAARPVVQ